MSSQMHSRKLYNIFFVQIQQKEDKSSRKKVRNSHKRGNSNNCTQYFASTIYRQREKMHNKNMYYAFSGSSWTFVSPPYSVQHRTVVLLRATYFFMFQFAKYANKIYVCFTCFIFCSQLKISVFLYAKINYKHGQREMKKTCFTLIGVDHRVRIRDTQFCHKICICRSLITCSSSIAWSAPVIFCTKTKAEEKKRCAAYAYAKRERKVVFIAPLSSS
jgi:hypothetical protein